MKVLILLDGIILKKTVYIYHSIPKAMKVFIISLLICFQSISTFAQTTEEIIKNHINAIGGELNWSKVKTLRLKGTLSVANGANVDIDKKIIKNKALRTDYTFKDRNVTKADKNYYVILTETGGWKYLPDNPNQEILKLYEPEIKQLKDELDFEDPFLWFEEKHREITMIGIEYFDEKEYFKFNIIYPSGQKAYCYINTSDFMINRMIWYESEAENFIIFENYEKLKEGVLISKKQTTPSGTFQINNFEINATISEHIFKPTAKNNFSR